MIKNARITNTHLGREDHGIPTCWVTLDYSSGGQSFGGYDLRFYGVKMLFGLIDAVGANSWEDLEGKVCRVDVQEGLVRGIGNIVEDEWYYPETQYGTTTVLLERGRSDREK